MDVKLSRLKHHISTRKHLVLRLKSHFATLLLWKTSPRQEASIVNDKKLMSRWLLWFWLTVRLAAGRCIDARKEVVAALLNMCVFFLGVLVVALLVVDVCDAVFSR